MQRARRNRDTFKYWRSEKNEGTLIPGRGVLGVIARVSRRLREFVRGDGAGWGEVRFRVDDALVSSYGDAGVGADGGSSSVSPFEHPQAGFSAVLRILS